MACHVLCAWPFNRFVPHRQCRTVARPRVRRPVFPAKRADLHQLFQPDELQASLGTAVAGEFNCVRRLIQGTRQRHTLKSSMAQHTKALGPSKQLLIAGQVGCFRQCALYIKRARRQISPAWFAIMNACLNTPLPGEHPEPRRSGPRKTAISNALHPQTAPVQPESSRYGDTHRCTNAPAR